MKTRRASIPIIAAGLALVLSGCSSGDATSRGLASIRGEDMKLPMKFLGSPEFLGRSTPSAELDIAAKYIALTAERIGLKPLLPGGSYYQEVPLEVTTIGPCSSSLRLVEAGGSRTFTFPADATAGFE